ncbi:MAG TPA: 16S rRNA (cytidine(1402)-2'-O)-methyltransferase, partial [Rhodocyclaceae bacterium]
LLSIVAIPIGNPSDITLRAIETLRAADAIICEEVKEASILLKRLEIKDKELIPLNEHNEVELVPSLMMRMFQNNLHLALISDCGTPVFSDPGAHLVGHAADYGIQVTPVPGASSLMAALSVLGVKLERFLFAGFLPTKATARRTEIEKLSAIPAALVFYEAPHRIEETIADLSAVLEPGRTLVVARELTKLFEQVAAMPLAEGPAWLAADPNRRRGEFVLVVSGPPPRTGLDAEVERVLKALLEELPVKQAAKLAAAITGAHKNDLYRRAIDLKGG